MENKLKNALNDFIGLEDETEEAKTNSAKKELLNTKSGLIERVDRIFVTNDGRQLLREQY